MIRNAEGKSMLEFRCASSDGLTVQDVIPPSIHPSGTQYQWGGKGSILDIPTIPKCLLDIWLSLLNPPAKANSNYSRSTLRKSSGNSTGSISFNLYLCRL
jgi:hypothetical protein